MIQKEYLKNRNKLKNKLQIQNSRSIFLQDQNLQEMPRKSTQIRKSYKDSSKTKSSKVFDLEQIKKQLGLIQLKNSLDQESQTMPNVQKIQFSPVPSFKKQTKQVKEGSDKRFTRNTSKMTVKEEHQEVEEKSGFTERVNELINLRVQHERIITSLMQKRVSNQSSEEESLALSRKKNPAFSHGEIRVDQRYDKQTSSKRSNMCKNISKFKKQQQHPNEKNCFANETKQNRIGKYQELVQPKAYSKNPIQQYSRKSVPQNKIILTENQTTKSSSEIVRQVKNFTQTKIQSLNQSQQVSRIEESVDESIHQINQFDQMNQSTFHVQQHVNLLASLLQFQNTHRKNSSIQKETSIENQLHYSIVQLLKSNNSSSKISKKLSLYNNSQVEIIYAGIDSQYRNYGELMNATKRIRGVSRDFVKVVEFLTENQVWEGLFRTESLQCSGDQINNSIKIKQFYGLCYDSGVYIEILLSNWKLNQDERKLLIFQQIDKQTLTCDITLILLSRLINLQVNTQFPQMINRLFGYQFKTFEIDKLNNFMQFLDYIDRLRDIHNMELRNQGGLIVKGRGDRSLRKKYSLQQIEQEESIESVDSIQILQDLQKHCEFELYGYNKTTGGYEMIRPAFFSEKNKIIQKIQLYEFRQLMRHQKYMKKLSDVYSKICVINKKELPVKSINLKHYDNHFVVVSVKVPEEGLYFFSVGQKIDCFMGNQASEVQTRYRLCLILTSTKTIMECVVLNSNESYPVYLAKEEFEMYISAYDIRNQSQDVDKVVEDSQQKINDKTFSFTFYIQSQHVIARDNISSQETKQRRQLQFDLRHKKQYNNYTSIIIEQFIEFSSLDREINNFYASIYYQPLENHQGIQIENNQSNRNDQKLLQGDETQSQRSYHFSNIQSPKQRQNVSQSKCLKPSSFSQIDTKNKQTEEIKSKQVLGITNALIAFDELDIEPFIQVINILRIHLKALDLFIDCIDTNLIENPNFNCQQNTKKITICYSQHRVLCDAKLQGNSVDLRPNTINLIYLTKNSNISSISYQNEISKKSNKKNLKSNQISYKIFRKEW